MIRLFLTGGGSILEGPYSNRQCEEYNVIKNVWSAIPPMVMGHGTCHTEALNFRGLIVVISGNDEQAIGTVEAYNPFLKSWHQMSALPERLAYMGAAAVDEVLFATGGLDKETGEISDAFFSLNLQSREWVSHEFRLPSARYGHTACCAWGNLWLCGGQLGTLPATAFQPLYTNTVEIYDPKSHSFMMGPPMLQLRMWFKALVINNELYIIGGDVKQTGNSITPSIEKLSTPGGAFEYVAVFPSNRRLFSVTAVGSKIFVFGGRDENFAPIDKWDLFDTETKSWASASPSASSQPPDTINGEGKVDCESTKAKIASNERISCATSNGGDGGDIWWQCVKGRDNMSPRNSFSGGQAVAYPPLGWG